MIISNMIIIKLVFRMIDVVFLPSKVNASFPKLKLACIGVSG